MKKLIGLCIGLFCLNSSIWSQPENGVHFLQVPQASWTNPALTAPGWQIGLPSIAGGFIQPSIQLDGSIKKINGQQILDLSTLSLVPGSTGRFQTKISAESLLLTHRKKRWSWSIGHKIQGMASVQYPQDGLNLLVHGNAPYTGRLIDLSHHAEGQAWHKISGGVGYHLPWLDAGIRINRYLGMGYFTTDRGQGSFYTDSLGYQVQVQTDVIYHLAGLWVNHNPATNTWEGEWRGRSGAGWGGDVGFHLIINPQWSVAGSWINMGQMFWNKNSQALTLKQDRTIRGVNIIPPFNHGTLESFDLSDTLYNLNLVTLPANFRSATPSETYLSIRHHFAQRWMASVLFAGQTNGKLKPAVYSARIGYRQTPGLETSVSLTYNSWGVWQMGWHGGWSFQGGQLFLVSDNILPVLNSKPWKGAHFRLGAALNFDKKGSQDTD